MANDNVLPSPRAGFGVKAEFKALSLIAGATVLCVLGQLVFATWSWSYGGQVCGQNVFALRGVALSCGLVARLGGCHPGRLATYPILIDRSWPRQVLVATVTSMWAAALGVSTIWPVVESYRYEVSASQFLAFVVSAHPSADQTRSW